MTDSQARDDEPAEVGAASASAATETTPLLQHDSGRHDTGPRTDEEQTTASGLVEPPQLRELGRLLVASQRYMFLASIAAVVLGAAVVIVGDLHPPGYSWNWSIQHNIGRIILNSFMTFLWALANLVWLRYTTRLLPYLFGIIAHFFLALYTTGWAVDSIYVMVVYPPYCYPSAPDNGYERCPVWRSYYHILLWFYLVVALVLGLAHVVIFFASCISAYLSVPPFRAGAESPAAARGHVGVLIPSGQLTFEFSIKLFRWQAAPVVGRDALAEAAAVEESPNAV